MVEVILDLIKGSAVMDNGCKNIQAMLLLLRQEANACSSQKRKYVK